MSDWLRRLKSLRLLAGNETRVTAVVADLSTAEGVEQVVSRAVEIYGGLDILVNNVGLARGATIADTSDAEWTEALDQTLFPAIRASRLAVPHMRRRGGGVDHHDRVDLGQRIRRPHDIQRGQGRGDQPGEVDGAATRQGQHPGQQRRAGIDFVPGWILVSSRQQEDPAGIADFITRELPFGRFGRAEEVGSVVAFLASARASWISGASIPVDGCQSRSNT